MESLRIFLETPIGLYNRTSSPFEILRQNHVPWEDLDISRACVPAPFMENPIGNVPFELKAELQTSGNCQRCCYRYPLPRLPHCRLRTAQRRGRRCLLPIS